MLKYIIKQAKFLKFILIILPFLLYANTLRNNYALDDSIVITENIYVQKGVGGLKDIFSNDTFTGFFKKKKDLVQGGRYRPLSLATFAIEKSIWGNTPSLSHLINAMLYSLLCLLLFNTIQKILLYLDKSELALPLAFLSTLIFIVHPIHTEVIANIKGRDEIMAVMFGLFSLIMFLKYIELGKVKYVLLSGGLSFLALLSKENALVFLFIAALLFLLKFKKNAYSRYIIGLLVLSISSGIYFIIRWKVLGGFSTAPVNELMNNPFLYAQDNQKMPTILYTLILYLKLLVFPQPLTYDYYPYHIQLQTWANPLVILSLTLYLSLLILLFYYFKKNKILAFAIGGFLITLLPVSNLLVNIGSFMNERFLFLPSVGFAIGGGYLIYALLKKIKSKTIIEFAFLIILCLFSAKTIARNRDWKDNFTLFTHDVKISKNSAKGNCTAGGALLEQAQKVRDEGKKQEYLQRSIAHLNTALEIYPNYIDALLLIGNAHYHYNKNYNSIFLAYENLFMLAPKYDLAYSNLNSMLAEEKDAEVRKKGYQLILKYRHNDFDANYQLGSTYGKMLNQFDSAHIYLSQAVQIRPESKLANRDLGVACALTGKFKESLRYFEKVLEIDPTDPANYINLGITYQNLGNSEKAAELFREAEKLKNSLAEKKLD